MTLTCALTDKEQELLGTLCDNRLLSINTALETDSSFAEKQRDRWLAESKALYDLSLKLATQLPVETVQELTPIYLCTETIKVLGELEKEIDFTVYVDDEEIGFDIFPREPVAKTQLISIYIDKESNPLAVTVGETTLPAERYLNYLRESLIADIQGDL